MIAPAQLPLALKLRAGSSLSSFITGDNTLLLAALDELGCTESGQLYLWGESGSGRSHLLEGKVREAGGAGCFLAAQELVSLAPDVLEGLEQFRVLAIDDIDLLAGRADWEAALFHLYNRLREAGGSLLVSARQPPGESGFQLADLTSRLAAGPVWRVVPLADEGLLELVRQRGRGAGLEVSDDVARYLLARSTRSAAAIAALLAQLDQLAMAHQRRLTIPFIRSLRLS
ncbi:DnaA regulatory inactivator Hda [Alcanivorax sp. 1008]|uniref:DnaA regulatory inactivator Hda n=1 Tax=Alcanivorax sp. 1008 TaxID=2816853 RepID=UPI001DC184BD|nr:DnaA regulatory inactivator Hda [Alcanivorax sp. 1008]MCC1495662.1 DnaA regulatory inactivator Hda [Alcanivorax sp. 1008]